MGNWLDQHRYFGPGGSTPSRALRRYATTGHYQVHGWLHEIAIWLLLDLARTQRTQGITGPVCEIGVHHGRLFILLHHLTNANERSVCWDLFENQDQNVDGSGKGDRERLMKNLERHQADVSRISIHTANSLGVTPSAVIEACDGAPRIFSVDGGHTAEVTESDLRVAAQSICDDGIIVLDDFLNEHFPGVAEGTCRYMAAPTVPLFPVAISANKFILTRRREMAEIYQQQISLPTPPLRRVETVVFGQPVLAFPLFLPPRKAILRSAVMKVLRQGRRAIRRITGTIQPS